MFRLQKRLRNGWILQMNKKDLSMQPKKLDKTCLRQNRPRLDI